MKLLYSSPETLGRPVWLPEGNSLLVPMGLPRENRAQIWEISYPGAERRRFTNDLSNYAAPLDVTRDRGSLVALDQKQTSHIWIAPGGRSDLARQITTGGTVDVGVAPGPANKLLLQSQGSDLVSINRDGTERNVVIPQLMNYLSRTACADRYLLFDSYEGSKLQLMRADADGSNPVTLSDDVGTSNCSPDGRWLIYESHGKIYRLAIEGGTPKEIASAPGGGDSVISPDGKLVAVSLQEGAPVPQLKVAVIPAEGGVCLSCIPLAQWRWGPALVARW